MSEHLIRAIKFAAVLAVAVLAGVAVTMATALLGHEVFVRIYGEDLASIDDTLPMIAAVSVVYLAGAVTGLVVLVLGWRRIVRRPATATGPR